MTKLGYYVDDSQISCLVVKKFFSEKNLIQVEIEELKNDI